MALVMETRPAAYAVIIEQGKLLMTRWVPEDRAQSPLWSLPGGGMEPGEQADETALRETLEETGYSVAIEDILGVHAGIFPHVTGSPTARCRSALCASSTAPTWSPVSCVPKRTVLPTAPAGCLSLNSIPCATAPSSTRSHP